MPKVRYYTMGMTVADIGYVAAPRRAACELLPDERREGEYSEWHGILSEAAPTTDTPTSSITILYPVSSYGETSAARGCGSGRRFDQRKMEARPDISSTAPSL